MWISWRGYRASDGRVYPITERYGYYSSEVDEVMSSKFSGGLKPVKNNEGKYGYINESGGVVIEYQFMNAFDFSEGLAAVQVSGRYGYINQNGEIIINPQFFRAGPFSEGLAAVDIGTVPGAGYINLQGNFIINPKFLKTYNFREGVAAVVPKAGKIIYINKEGEEVPSPEKK